MTLERLGHEVVSKRDLYVLALDRIEQLPSGFRLPSRYFVCLIVGDTRHIPDGDVQRFVRVLLSAGAVYLCAWGPGSDRAHDLLDDAILMPPYEPSDDTHIPTTAHGEGLAEALHFLLFCTSPAPAYEESCQAALVLLIGFPEHADLVREALQDPKAFVTRLFGDEGAA